MKKITIALLVVLSLSLASKVSEADDSRAGWEGIGQRWMYEGLECFYVGPLQSTGSDGFSFGFNWQWHPGAIEFWPDRTFFKGSEVAFSGQVGIGDATPDYALDVESDSYNVISALYTGTNSSARGVYGNCAPDDDKGYGGYFTGGYIGAYGRVIPTGDQVYHGVRGYCDGGTGDNHGVYGRAINSSTACYGVAGEGDGISSAESFGVYGEAKGSGYNYGVYGCVLTPSNNPNYGVLGLTEGSVGNHFAVRGFADGTPVGQNFAGRFSGDVGITGNLTKSSGAFKIDHPLDPENKYLVHSFVESPDMKNVYDGTVVLEFSGEAVVTLPGYFQALNKDFRYQLTCIGGWAPVYIAQKIENNEFLIAGGEPGMEVSWQVTGTRKDPYAERNRIQVEVEKSEQERGTYLHPDVYDLPEEFREDFYELERLRAANKRRLEKNAKRQADVE